MYLLINKLLLKGEVEDLVEAINNLSDLKKIEKAEDEIKDSLKQIVKLLQCTICLNLKT